MKDQVDSIKKRFGVTLFSNVVRLVINIVKSAIVPRALEASGYGSFEFLLASFNSIRGFLDFGSSAAFFTYNSKRDKSDIVVVVYSVYMLIQLTVIMTFISLAVIGGYNNYIWPEQLTTYVWLIAGVEFVMFVSTLFVSFGDSRRITVTVRIVSMVVNVFVTLLILLLFFLDQLSLDKYIVVNYLNFTLVCVVIAYVLLRNRETHFVLNWSKSGVKDILSYFWQYCHPLVVYTFVGFVVSFFDRWLLQFVGGSAEQGYYSLAYKWASISLIFTTSILNIYWKEIAYLYGANDLARLTQLYKKTNFLLFGLAAIIGVFVFTHSKRLVLLVAGSEYKAAVVPFMIMAFYPLHLTIGQLNGTLFYATERTKLYRNLGIITMLTGLVLTYFLLAPKDNVVPGLGFGAIGLATKNVSINICSVNLAMFFNTKFLNEKFRPFLLNQVSVIVIYLLISGLTYYPVKSILNLVEISSDVVFILVHGVFYTSGVALLVYSRPVIHGLTRNDFNKIIVEVKHRLFKSTS